MRPEFERATIDRDTTTVHHVADVMHLLRRVNHTCEAPACRSKATHWCGVMRRVVCRRHYTGAKSVRHLLEP